MFNINDGNIVKKGEQLKDNMFLEIVTGKTTHYFEIVMRFLETTKMKYAELREHEINLKLRFCTLN